MDGQLTSNRSSTRTCPACGFDLSGSSGSCPRCGLPAAGADPWWDSYKRRGTAKRIVLSLLAAACVLVAFGGLFTLIDDTPVSSFDGSVGGAAPRPDVPRSHAAAATLAAQPEQTHQAVLHGQQGAIDRDAGPSPPDTQPGTAEPALRTSTETATQAVTQSRAQTATNTQRATSTQAAANTQTSANTQTASTTFSMQSTAADADPEVAHIREMLYETKPVEVARRNAAADHARQCEQQQQWECVRLSASEALATDPGDTAARDMLARAVRRLAWPALATASGTAVQAAKGSATGRQ